MTKTNPRLLASAALAASAIALSSYAAANNGITTESVNDYTLIGASFLGNSIANSSGFKTTMTGTGQWTSGVTYTNSSVYDMDFVDPEKVGGVDAYDTSNFDRSTDAISYFTGHGLDQLGGGTCTSSSQCTANGNGFCRTSPPNNKYCSYTSPRYIITSSASDKRGHFITYGNGQVALGDGAWGNYYGAGTNGGINLAVLDLSHGVTSMFWNEELSPAFAGLHLLATIMPINGDTANVSNRGSTFANQFVANPNGSVATAWMETLNAIPQYGTWSCGNPVWNNYSNGGGHGINGCGCNFMYSVDSSTYWSNWHINNETWNDLKNDGYDGDGANNFTWEAICNYDSNTYPWAI